MKKILIVIGAVVISLFMVLGVTAMPQVSSSPVLEKIKMIEESKNVIENFDQFSATVWSFPLLNFLVLILNKFINPILNFVVQLLKLAVSIVDFLIPIFEILTWIMNLIKKILP